MISLKKAIKDMDKPLLIVISLLLIFGLLNIVSASSQVAVLKYNLALYNYFFKQAIFTIISIIISIFIIKIPTKSYKFFGMIVFLFVGLTSLAVSFSSFGANYSGNNNWINIKGFTFQPSEFGKIAMIVCIALLFEKYYKKIKAKNIEFKNKYDIVGKILLVGAFFPGMVYLQHDFGTTIILTTIFGILLLSSPFFRIDKLKIIGFCLVVGFIGLMLFKGDSEILSSTQSSRFDFYDPCSEYETGGYQICNGFIAINSGGLLGNGIGNSKQISYIPESHTDSVFAIIAEQYGLIITTLILAAYLFILYRILYIANVAKTIRGRYICLGIASYIFLHILINLGGLFGIMPLTGVPLPFLSSGGSFAIALICSVAIVLRVSIENKKED